MRCLKTGNLIQSNLVSVELTRFEREITEKKTTIAFVLILFKNKFKKINAKMILPFTAFKWRENVFHRKQLDKINVGHWTHVTVCI